MFFSILVFEIEGFVANYRVEREIGKIWLK